jgi:hypothetical protein
MAFKAISARCQRKMSGFEKKTHFEEMNTRDWTIASVFRHNVRDLKCPEGVFHHNHLTDVRNSRQLCFLYSLTICEKVDRNLCGVAELESWLHGYFIRPERKNGEPVAATDASAKPTIADATASINSRYEPNSAAAMKKMAAPMPARTRNTGLAAGIVSRSSSGFNCGFADLSIRSF